MLRHAQRGFVPAWFMDGIILLAVVGVLLAILIPAVFRALAGRTVSRALAAAVPIETEVAAYLAREGRAPHYNATLGLPAPTRFAGPDLQSIAVIDGELIVRIAGNHLVDGRAVVLGPVFDLADRAAPVGWRCQDSALLEPGRSVEVERPRSAWSLR